METEVWAQLWRENLRHKKMDTVTYIRPAPMAVYGGGGGDAEVEAQRKGDIDMVWHGNYSGGDFMGMMVVASMDKGWRQGLCHWYEVCGEGMGQ